MDWIGSKCFSAVHKRNIVYNTCWEDPKLDRVALDLSEDDRILVITSAGCNALDYALQAPASVHAVDMNPLQNALLELKIASLRQLSHGDFFKVFGRGWHEDWRALYYDSVRRELSPCFQQVWDKRVSFFDGSSRRKSFYFRGTSGFFAWLINGYLNRPSQLRRAVDEILDANTVEQQAEIYHRRNVDVLLWRQLLRWLLKRDTTLAMLGVPRSQRRQIDQDYPGGIAQFIRDRIETVFTKIPLSDNYFWRVYLTGSYTQECCPEYLKKENSGALQRGLVNRISTHSTTVQGFLDNYDGQISRFVLLDHMDWLYEHFPQRLTAEWQSIMNRASPHARVLWRSAALKVDFVDPLPVRFQNHDARVGELLRYHPELAKSLHASDRVHTYGSFYIADITGNAA